jgi:bifunctional polynucleotide phosphatase/kinase
MNHIYFNKISRKAAIFDLDHTIIRPINKRFSTTSDDWKFNSDNVIQKLKKCKEDGYDVIIISNQKILKNDDMKKEWTVKIEKISKKIGFNIMALAATEDDNMRKPRTGFWDKYCFMYDKTKSFYVGDAGGLPKRSINGETVKDFSDTDLKFALNTGIKFIHRDEFFYGADPKTIKLEPKYPINLKDIKIGEYNKIKLDKNTMYINVGFPGSGKSYFSNNFIKSKYSLISQDALRSKNKCIKLCDAICKNAKKSPIVIDNTNPSKETRKLYINIAIENDYKVICHHFTTSFDLSMHNNIYRSTISNRKIVPKIAYNIYRSKYEEPTIDEGITKIVDIDFIFDKKYDTEKYLKYMF